MALRVAASASLLISQDNAPTPSEPSFSTGPKQLVDTTTYAYEASGTLKVAAGASNQAINLGTMTEADVLYLFTATAGLTIKMTPPGGGSPVALELVPSFPNLFAFKLQSITVSNPGMTDAVLVFGAAGN